VRALLKTGLALLALAFILIGALYTLLRAHGASGPANPEGRLIARETRSVGNQVNAVELSGPIDLTLRYGPTASLVVSGEQRLLGNVESTASGTTLRIGTRGIVLSHRRPLQALLVLPNLVRLAVDGSGDSSVDGFSGERIELRLVGSGSVKFNGRYRAVAAALHGSGDLELEGGSSDLVEADVSGSGDMTLIGSAKELHARVRGAGDLDAKNLRADAVTVQELGSGNSAVFARERIAASVNGSGDIQVRGHPSQRSVSRNGSGEVSFSD
jgi:hypothetical protein